jgi:GNAT superfamily N-acetyltransferase
MSELLIRPARDEDRAALGALKLRSSLAWGDHVEELRALPEARAVPLAHMPHAIVAERDGTIVGFATVLAGKDGEAELEDLFVAPEQWRTGVGSKLLAEAEQRAVDGGARVLHVVAGARARPFYEASGFRLVGTVATAFEPADELDKDLSGDDRRAPRPRRG